MGAMEDTQTTRHRRGRIKLVVESGGELVEHPPTSTTAITSTTTTTTSKVKPPIKRRKKRRREKQDAIPFWMLFLQVAVTLFVICWSCYRVSVWFWPSSQHQGIADVHDYNDGDDDGANQMQQQRLQQQKQTIKLSDLIKKNNNNYNNNNNNNNNNEQTIETTPPPLPTFPLSPMAQYDAFGVLDFLNTTTTTKRTAMTGNNTSKTNYNFWRAARRLLQRFAENYGGENAARMLLDKGLSTFVEPPPPPPSTATAENFNHTDTSEINQMPLNLPSDMVYTACRMHDAQQSNRPFQIAFAGYSVTAGRGNYFSQSFPFCMERLLNTLFGLVGLDVQVRNAAIGGCPAFPYGWCLTNFLGENPDVVSWDYSMNEAGGVPEGLEAYIRQVLQLPRRPKIIVKDTYLATQRRDVLAHYVPYLKDPVVIHTDPAVQPFLERDEAFRPEGFQKWRKFGAPKGAPGQALHHPAVKEHELIGWLLAMHFLPSLELLVAEADWLTNNCPSLLLQEQIPLKAPISGTLTNTTTMQYPSILFGTKTAGDTWTMNPIHCRTTFQPILHGNVTSIVVSGTVAEDINIMLPKSQMYYNRAWTMDLSEGEKAAKRKLDLYDQGLGFIDVKQAYYGIFTSGRMTLLLPYEENPTQSGLAIASNPKSGDLAIDWFESLVICQVNEKRDSGACNSATDVAFIVGGVNATNATMMGEAGTLYLGKKMCTNIVIPKDAVLTTRHQVQLARGRSLAKDDTDHGAQAEIPVDPVGLLVEIFVTNRHIVHLNQACSVSHVIWEQRRVDGSSSVQ